MGKFFNEQTEQVKLAKFKFREWENLFKHWEGRTFTIGDKTITAKQRIELIPPQALIRIKNRLKRRHKYAPDSATHATYLEKKTGVRAFFAKHKHGDWVLQTVYPKGMKFKESRQIKYWDLNNLDWRTGTQVV